MADKLVPSKSVTDSNKCQTSSAMDDIRENIVCYRDEGGGEDDVRAYDLIALRIQMPNNHADLDGFGCEQNNVHGKSSVNFGKSYHSLC